MEEIKCKWQNTGLLWLRILVGAGLIYHGYGKIFGGFIGGFAEALGKMGLPWPMLMAWLESLSEFAGGILIIAGLFTRFAALSVFISMSVAVFLAHKLDPFKVKELALAYWTIAGTLMLTGSGAFGLDSKWCCKKKKEESGQ